MPSPDGWALVALVGVPLIVGVLAGFAAGTSATARTWENWVRQNFGSEALKHGGPDG